MHLDHLPISHYIAQRYMTPAIQKLVDGWRVEPQLVVDRAVEYFKDMGIYSVPRSQDSLIMSNLMRYLKTSTDLQRMVSRARAEELKRQRNRHSE
jgi:hypothetical protein